MAAAAGKPIEKGPISALEVAVYSQSRLLFLTEMSASFPRARANAGWGELWRIAKGEQMRLQDPLLAIADKKHHPAFGGYLFVLTGRCLACSG